jgi:hypothetical protein
VRNAEAAASSLDIEIVPTPVAGATDIERGIEAFSRAPNGGLLLPTDGTEAKRTHCGRVLDGPQRELMTRFGHRRL